MERLTINAAIRRRMSRLPREERSRLFEVMVNGLFALLKHWNMLKWTPCTFAATARGAWYLVVGLSYCVPVFDLWSRRRRMASYALASERQTRSLVSYVWDMDSRATIRKRSTASSIKIRRSRLLVIGSNVVF